MELEKVVALIVASAARLAAAVKLSRRDEKLWAAMAREDWNLIQLAWALRGVILKRGKGNEAELYLDDTLENLLKNAGSPSSSRMLL
ncbi:hypothetical protein ES705_11112 [subsurface metagenome]